MVAGTEHVVENQQLIQVLEILERLYLGVGAMRIEKRRWLDG